MKFRHILGTSVGFLSLAVAGCSGGGGVVIIPPPTGKPSPAPTPTPTPTPAPTPPPTGVNADLLEPVESETFANRAAGYSGSYNADGGLIESSSGPTDLALVYDADTETYTVSVAGRTQEFGPADIDTAASDDQFTVYDTSADGVEESLTLTKPGTEGRFTYRYVGAGLWQRIMNADRFDAMLDAFVYGALTPDAEVPRTGTGTYAIDVLGSRTFEGTVVGLSGNGQFDIAFGLGTFGFAAQMNGARQTDVTFTGEGTLSSDSNDFTGTVAFEDGSFQFAGTVNGSFFGPDAAELGAAWSAKDDSAAQDVAAGVIIGRSEGELASNDSFDDRTNSQFFTTTGFAIDGDGNVSRETLTVYYNAATDQYRVRVPDGSGGTTSVVLPGEDMPGTTGYTRFDGTSYVLSGFTPSRQFVFGYETPEGDVPTTGSANYAIEVSRRNRMPADRNGGNGVFTVNFGDGSIDLIGRLTRGVNDQVDEVYGTFEGAGMLAATRNAFDGTMDVTARSGDANSAFTTYTGPFAGGFFGPNAAEVGGSFALTGDMGVFEGSFAGPRDDTVMRTRPLSEFEGTTTFATVRSAIHFEDTLNTSTKTGGTPVLTWNADNGTYTVDYSTRSPQEGLDPEFTFSFAEAQRDDAASGPLFDVYRFADAAGDFVGRVYRPGNSEIALTYTSFVELRRTQTLADGSGGTTDYFSRYYMPFGSRTGTEMPITGRATYSGVLYGTGTRYSGTARNYYDLTGTSSLDVDFGRMELTGSITAMGTDIFDGSTYDFGTYFTELNALGNPDIIGDRFSGSGTMDLFGYFFGPRAAEFAARFSVKEFKDGGSNTLEGIAIGKKDASATAAAKK